MTIGEASEKTGLSADTLRYYERIGLIPPVPRRENGLRDYGENIMKKIDGLLACLRRADDQLAHYESTVTPETELAVSGWAARETRAGAAA